MDTWNYTVNAIYQRDNLTFSAATINMANANRLFSALIAADRNDDLVHMEIVHEQGDRYVVMREYDRAIGEIA